MNWLDDMFSELSQAMKGDDRRESRRVRSQDDRRDNAFGKYDRASRIERSKSRRRRREDSFEWD